MGSTSNEQRLLTSFASMAELIEKQKRLLNADEVDWEQYADLDAQLKEIQTQIESSMPLPTPDSPAFQTVTDQLRNVLAAQQELENLLNKQIATVTHQLGNMKKQQKRTLPTKDTEKTPLPYTWISVSSKTCAKDFSGKG